jgi:hypothetical protein
VLYLEHGLIENAVYHNKGHQAFVIANSFNGFLERLLADVRAYIGGDPEWQFMDAVLYNKR